MPIDQLLRAIAVNRLDEPLDAIVSLVADIRPDVKRKQIEAAAKALRDSMSRAQLQRGAERSAERRGTAATPAGERYHRKASRPAVPKGVEVAEDWVPVVSPRRTAHIITSGQAQWVHFGMPSETPEGRLRFLFQSASVGAPHVRLDLDDSGACPVISRLEVLAPPDSDAGVTWRVIRALPVSQFLAAARAYAERSRSWGADPAAVAKMRRRLERLRGKERGGRARPDSFYRRIALTYLGLLEDGVTRGIHRLIAEEEGLLDSEGKPDAAKARDAVNTAKDRGFLGSGQPGKAGRGPGPRLNEEAL